MLGKIIEAVIRNHQQTNIFPSFGAGDDRCLPTRSASGTPSNAGISRVNLHSTAAKNILFTLLVIWQQTFFR